MWTFANHVSLSCLFNCQRTDTIRLASKLYHDWPSIMNVLSVAWNTHISASLYGYFKSKRCCRQRRAALVVGVYSPYRSKLSTGIFKKMRFFLKLISCNTEYPGKGKKTAVFDTFRTCFYLKKNWSTTNWMLKLRFGVHQTVFLIFLTSMIQGN